MAEKINIELTKNQLRTLLDIVFAGNMVLSGTNDQDEEKYNEVESLIFGMAEKSGEKGLAEFDKAYGGWLPSKKFEDSGVLQRMDGYEDFVFWSELARRLALKDIATQTKLKDPDLIFEAMLDRADEYEDFFDEKGIGVLEVKGMKAMKTPESYKSVGVGEIESDPEYERILDQVADECDDDDCDCHDDGCDCHDEDCECHHHNH